MNIKFYSKFRGIYYRYVSNLNKWVLSDRKDGSNNVMWFDGDSNRLDECFDKWKKNNTRVKKKVKLVA
jgi:hypothetical protein